MNLKNTLSHKFSQLDLDYSEGYQEVKMTSHILTAGKKTKCAISNGWILLTDKAEENGLNTYSLFDSIDAEVWSFYEQCKLQELFDSCLPSKVVIISEVAVNPEYRNKNIGLSVVKTWIEKFLDPTTLFLLHPGAINRTDSKYPSWFHFGSSNDHKRRNDYPGEVLERYWRKAGFKTWQGTDHMFLAGVRVQEEISNLSFNAV